MWMNDDESSGTSFFTLLYFTSGNSWAIGDPGSGSGAELVYNVSLDLGITLLDETGVQS